jgi:hypothetical protein
VLCGVGSSAGAGGCGEASVAVGSTNRTVAVGRGVRVSVGGRVGRGVWVSVGVRVGRGVRVSVGVPVGRGVRVLVGVRVGCGVWVAMAARDAGGRGAAPLIGALLVELVDALVTAGGTGNVVEPGDAGRGVESGVEGGAVGIR